MGIEREKMLEISIGKSQQGDSHPTPRRACASCMIDFWDMKRYKYPYFKF